MSYSISGVKEALQCVSSNVSRDEKGVALQYLEQFQKAPDTWQLCHMILLDSSCEGIEIQIFASQTLRNKVTYDLNQLEGNLEPFKQSMLDLLVKHTNKLIVTQLSVMIARLAIQYLEWRNPIGEIFSVLYPYPGKLLEFLKILPEETLDMKSTPLSEDEFKSRTHELINQIAEDVMVFILSCVNSVHNNPEYTVEQVLKCLSTWIYEFPIEQVFTVTPLINLVFEVLFESHDDYPEAFEAAVECLSVLLRETRDVANPEIIKMLYDRLLLLQNKLLPFNDNDSLEWSDYEDIMDALTRLFVEAGEAWCVFIGKEPESFRPLVQVILVLTCKNTDLDVVKYTFPFWFNLKQMLVLERYQRQKMQYRDIYVELIKGIIKHLEYPTESFPSKEDEDKYREFRYDMGDVLKDCTAIVGATEALTQPFEMIKSNLELYETTSQWQKLEAPLFSLRAMGQDIPTSENVILPQIFQIICNLQEHPKVRYAVTLVLGRYTEWTSKHPEFLEMELNYIFGGFQLDNDVAGLYTAASHALMYFCQDCSSLLSGYVEQLIEFAWKIEKSVDMVCMFEVCQGLSSVINEQPIEKFTSAFELFLNPLSERLKQAVEAWKAQPNKETSIEIADLIDLVFAMFESLRPRYEDPSMGAEPLLPHMERIWNILSDFLSLEGAASNTIIVERAMKLLRRFFERYHVFLEPILPMVVEMLARNYLNTGLGSYLWCSGSLIYVFGDDESYPVSPELKQAVWLFACSQCEVFLNNFSKIGPNEIDVYYENIQDFFVMVLDVIMFYPKQFITATALIDSVADCASKSLDKLNNFESYITVIRCLDEILSWGFATPPISTMEIDTVPMEWRENVLRIMVLQKGSQLVSVTISGLTTNLNSNAHPEAIGLLVKLFKLAVEANNNDPSICMVWLSDALEKLRPVSPNEKNKLMSIGNALVQRDYRRVRNNIKDFIGWYLRKHVSPRFYG
ncbi:HHL255Wp [Eremothecium sinecaudum]|uniref:HHL255Wp n=1 Tax=Eremothecium sinecaudum TaxID=45286 RepID=A0A109V072_9SACH|nr:HHL255Wp [Eremothecium sinecaudum]AMD22515.1 HHL255Wp [Eremothecium sinecaudum]